MCGIAGLIEEGSAAAPADELAITVARMAAALSHRGPDSQGVWVDPETRLALGHRRLAIVDLSADGAQPMISAGGRFVIVFNGEIYNFRDLRRELEASGARFRGHCDTEVLLAAVEAWGLDEALSRAAGMFAFALWDRQTRHLHLVRDRLGKKPLYFAWVGERFLFASELKAFHALRGFAPVVDRGALALLLHQSCIPAPLSIYRDVFKLPAGGRLSLRPNGSNAPRRGRDLLDLVETYWSVLDVAERGAAAPLATAAPDGDAVVDQLDELLGRAVGERMIADVPLGALLSGGIDSSLVVALMQRQAAQPARTFSIGFHQRGYDEATDAARVADWLKTDHTELYVTPEEARAVIPRLPEFYDEPFADSSQIPTFLVSQLARRHVTVALSGDGGDEVFGGYRRHVLAPRLARLNRLPAPLRRAAAGLLTVPSPGAWDGLFSALSPVLPGGLGRTMLGDQVNAFARTLRAPSLATIHQTLGTHWAAPAAVVRGAAPAAGTGPRQPRLDDFTHAMMALDGATYLPDDVLTKVDRASMAVSLEVRSPLLDHRVVEFAWRLPLGLKVHRGQGKWILRRVLERYVPRQLFERPKQGFAVPLADWLRGPLQSWAAQLLDERRLDDEGFFEPRPIRHKWVEHLSGRRNWAPHLWDVLMFQAWRERWLP